MATILAKTVHGCRRAGLIGIALLALGSASPAQSADTTMITIQNYAFMPPELVVKPGTTEPLFPKISFVTKVGELGCGVGYYK